MSAFMLDPKGPIAIAPSSSAAKSPMVMMGHSLDTRDSSQRGTNDSSQPLSRRQLPLQLRHKPRVLLGERLSVLVLLLRPDVAAGGEHVAVIGDLIDRRGLSETGSGREGPRAMLALVPPFRGGLAAPAT